MPSEKACKPARLASVTILYAYGAAKQASHIPGLGPSAPPWVPWAIAVNPAQSNLDNLANLNLSKAI